MKRLIAILVLLAAGCLLASSLGCAGGGGGSYSGTSGYYGRGTIHRDSFPTPYGPGSPYRYGRPRYYRR